MKILKFIIALFVMALSCTSCLESNLEQLDTYEGNDITSGYAWYRYKGDNTLNASGEQQIIQKELQRTGQVINNEEATCACSLKFLQTSLRQSVMVLTSTTLLLQLTSLQQL